MGFAQSFDLALGCGAGVLGSRLGGVGVGGELDDEFAVEGPGVFCARMFRLGTAVAEETGVPVGVFFAAAVLDCGGLEEDEEVFPGGGEGEAFKALVVGATGFGVFGLGLEGGVVAGWVVGGEGDDTFAAGNN